MLGKLLKHELRATTRILLPVYVLLFVSAGLFNLTMRLSDDYEILALDIFRGLIGFVFVVTVIGAGVLTVALMVYRFYKNFMTDEGYLMFTLPVRTGELIWSKLLVALLWTVATAVADVLAVMLAMAGRPVLQEMLPGLAEMWSHVVSTVPTAELVTMAAQGVLSTLLSTLSSFLMFYAAIALGHSFANHKILLSVVFYFGFNFALQTLGSFAGVFGIIYLDSSEAFYDGALDALGLTGTVLWGALGASLLLAAIFYVVTHLTLKKRLNLQ